MEWGVSGSAPTESAAEQEELLGPSSWGRFRLDIRGNSDIGKGVPNPGGVQGTTGCGILGDQTRSAKLDDPGGVFLNDSVTFSCDHKTPE